MYREKVMKLFVKEIYWCFILLLRMFNMKYEIFVGIKVEDVKVLMVVSSFKIMVDDNLDVVVVIVSLFIY